MGHHYGTTMLHTHKSTRLRVLGDHGCHGGKHKVPIPIYAPYYTTRFAKIIDLLGRKAKDKAIVYQGPGPFSTKKAM